MTRMMTMLPAIRSGTLTRDGQHDVTLRLPVHVTDGGVYCSLSCSVFSPVKKALSGRYAREAVFCLLGGVVYMCKCGTLHEFTPQDTAS